MGGLLYWIWIFGFIPWFLLALFQGFYFAIFALLFSLLKREGVWGAILSASLWVGIDYLRGIGKFGFTWGTLAQSQFLDVPLLGICKIGGMWLLTFCIVFSNAILTFLAPRKKFLYWMGFLLLLHLLGFACNKIWYATPRFEVAIMQAGEGQRLLEERTIWGSPSISQLIETYRSLAEKIGKPSLIVFPETAFPVSILEVKSVENWLAMLARSKNAYVLVGTPVEENGKIFNRAFLFSPEGEIVDKYDKVHLVPYGEFVPGRERFPWLKKFGIRDFDFSPGKEWRPLPAGGIDIGVMICFESIFPWIGRKLVRDGADVLVVMTNDSWFGRTWAAEQHLAFSALRASEEGSYLIRATTSGISALIAPNGRILQRTPLFQPAFLEGKVGKAKPTPYTFLGDSLMYVFYGFLLWEILGKLRKALWRK